jgi:hypothetical protein
VVADIAREAKSLVALAFRKGPIEDVHAGRECPTCAGKPEYSRITEAEMKSIMENAVDTVYKLLWMKKNDPEKVASQFAPLGVEKTRICLINMPVDSSWSSSSLMRTNRTRR